MLIPNAISYLSRVFQQLSHHRFHAILTISSISTIVYLIPYFYFHFNELIGVLLANCLLDILFYDTYFIIGHFHFVLLLGAVYSILVAFLCYFPKFSPHPIPEFTSRFLFLTLFISSNLLFFPMHSIGILGHSRRIFDYPILFSHFHYFQSIGISGVFLAMIFLIFTL